LLNRRRTHVLDRMSNRGGRAVAFQRNASITDEVSWMFCQVPAVSLTWRGLGSAGDDLEGRRLRKRSFSHGLASIAVAAATATPAEI
jgi:hypothetical protein